MENVKASDEFIYNPDAKNDFLTMYTNEATQVTYRRIFAKSYDLEVLHEKDLYDFNMNELSSFFFELEPSTDGSARTNGRIVTAYWDWAIEKGLRTNKNNSLKSASPAWFSQFTTGAQLFITEMELKQIENICKNAQDAVCFRLLYEGLGGIAWAELCNLKKKDVDSDNHMLKLTDQDGSEITNFKVSKDCIELIKQAIKQREYVKLNGKFKDPNGRMSNIIEMTTSDFVLRNCITRSDNSGNKVDNFAITRRILTIKTQSGLPQVTAKNISRSGMLKMAKDFMDQDGELTKEHIAIIMERYRVKNIASTADYLNEKTVNELYGVVGV